MENLLSPESEEEVQAHLRECAACREIYQQMNSPEPLPIEAVREVDYLKKVKRDRIKLLAGSILAVAAILSLSVLLLKLQSAKTRQYAAKADELSAIATEYAEIASEYAALAEENAKLAEESEKKVGVGYDWNSKTVVVFGLGDRTYFAFPEELTEAKALDAQFDSFHLSAYLPTLKTDEPLDAFLSGYLDRTLRSIEYLRAFLRTNCTDAYYADRINQYVELSISKHEILGWKVQDDRIMLEMGGSNSWYRDVLYVLSLIGNKKPEWKELGYAWYLASCVDPYGEKTIDAARLESSPCYEAYLRSGGSEENTPENWKLLYDAIAYTCLEQGMDWGDSYESHPMKNIALFGGPSYNKDAGNEMSVIMAASFVGYLIHEYGFDRVSAFCFGRCSFAQAFGTDYETAYEAWGVRLNETCGEASDDISE